MDAHETGAARYPLGERAAGNVRSSTGLPLADLTIEAILDGRVGADDLRISRETLLQQSDIAEDAGYAQLAANLRRAAELVDIPSERLLHIYNALRPRRSTYEELLALCDELEAEFRAPATARFVRQAADAYRAEGLLREGRGRE